MLNLLFLLFTGFAIGLTGAIIPGPLTLFTVSAALKTDQFAGFKTIIGHIIVELFLIVLIFLGFHRLLVYKSFLFTVSILGGASLIIMGLLLFFKAGKMNLSALKGAKTPDRGLILGGIIFSSMSPGFFVWWATIGLSTILKAALLGFGGVVMLLIGHWFADILWYGFIGYGVNKGKTYLSDRSYQNIIRVSAGLLIFVGGSFLFFNN
ncbi:MAG: LysE family transporter [PVC group bacterium]|nr:LysE family transporter [PVC group bacterium]